jgi:hypothetical protein
MRVRSISLALAAGVACSLAGCDRLRTAIEPDGEEEREREEREEREREGEKGEEGEHGTEEEREHQDHLWRVGLVLIGEGTVQTNIEGIPEMWMDCTRDAKGQSGECGPKLLRWKEVQPPLLDAHGAKGWKFVRWESRTRRWSGGIAPTAKVIAPGNRLYLNGMGNRDTGACEILTAHFEKQADPTFQDYEVANVPNAPAPTPASTP